MPGVCSRCHRDVYFAEEKLALEKVWHIFCFTCRNCHKLLDSCTVTTHCGELFCKNCYLRQFPPTARISKLSKTAQSPEKLVNSHPESFAGCSCCGTTSNFPVADSFSKKSRLRGGGIDGEEKVEQICGTEQGDVPCSEVDCCDVASVTTSTCNPPATPSLPPPTYKSRFYPHRGGDTYPPLPPHYKPPQPLRKVSLSNNGTDVFQPCQSTIMQNADSPLVERQISKDEVSNGQDRRYDIWRADSPNNDRASDYCDAVCTCGGLSACCLEKNMEDSPDDLDFNERRLRGGCGGNCKGNSCRAQESYPSEKRLEHTTSNEMNAENYKVCARGSISARDGICPPRERESSCRRSYDNVSSSPCAGKSGCCPPAGNRPHCKKTPRCTSPCTAGDNHCGGGGCCGGGCRGGCGRPGQLCMPARPCTVPPCLSHAPASISPCAPPRSSGQQPSCCRNSRGTNSVPLERLEQGRGVGSSGGLRNASFNCNRPSSPRSHRQGSYNEDSYQAKPLSACECLGGGPDCQRCGRKVYHAEMQIASGVPYHSICFSCYCCRKPLEPLTYQENCGEIYCKQCYIRNFGPQGYGYGIGAGVLQTPM